MNRQALYGFLIGAAVLGVVLLWFQTVVMPDRTARPRVDLPSARTNDALPEPEVAQPPAASDDTALFGTKEVPPLFDRTRRHAEPPETGGGPTPPGVELSRTQQRTIARIQRELAAVSRPGTNASPAQVGRLLRGLREAIGSDRVGGVDLEALEDTVDRAGRIQSLAREMESIAENPGKGDEQRLQTLMTRIRNLQQGMPESVSTDESS
ncbi:hypothetical protein [Arhodomonas sp. AD133]|uniref:hypothetical protein n=1 Tax=Arhodomonas sp. AD133 TaxID=3415009 RepID=UPI003EBAC2E2